ncbi:hypothetical protein FGG08_003999 [Glutinoglossum americanum]|uniref:Laccase n=1 Tax=Glutinoglossum americanum TaxID=1670608 RepID=A0A9P8L350_9PEZI|nr:hypothetical protein FGG08_003999 [Glutinoglossum americanum]
MSPSLFHLSLLLLLPFGLTAYAATVTYDWSISWVTANPDNALARPVIGINQQWPLPHLIASVGDRVIVNVANQLGNQSTSLHFHGLFQNGTTHMDGPVGVTQCAIPPGGRFTYNFTIDQAGTYWYHSHVRGQYPDGLRGALIVHDPESPYKDQYDEELVLTLSDWYHSQMPPLIDRFLSYANPTGAEPVPEAALFNDTQNLKVRVQPGKTYLIRMINMAAFAAQYLWFEGHTMRIVEVDGVYTEPKDADMIYMTAAQRYSVLLTMRNDTDTNFAFVGSMDQDLFDQVPPSLNPNVTGWLVYDETKDLPKPTLIDEFTPIDDFTLVPHDGEKLFENVDYSFNLDVKMDNLGDGANYAFFNDITYMKQKVPTLYTALTTGTDTTNALVYGINTNPYILKKDDVVEIIVNNDDPGKHPFHLHGHNFQVVTRSEEDGGFFNGSTPHNFPAVPMKRDVVMVKPNGNIVLRFKADNPDKSIPSNSQNNSTLSTDMVLAVHVSGSSIVISNGMSSTMIEAPEELQKNLKIPDDHMKVCVDDNVPTAGNAAGNTKDFLDLTGQVQPPAPIPAGYGMGELGPSELARLSKAE